MAVAGAHADLDAAVVGQLQARVGVVHGDEVADAQPAVAGVQQRPARRGDLVPEHRHRLLDVDAGGQPLERALGHPLAVRGDDLVLPAQVDAGAALDRGHEPRAPAVAGDDVDELVVQPLRIVVAEEVLGDQQVGVVLVAQQLDADVRGLDGVDDRVGRALGADGALAGAVAGASVGVPAQFAAVRDDEDDVVVAPVAEAVHRDVGLPRGQVLQQLHVAAVVGHRVQDFGDAVRTQVLVLVRGRRQHERAALGGPRTDDGLPADLPAFLHRR